MRISSIHTDDGAYFTMFKTLLEHWGYLAVWAGTLLEGEATLLGAGALVHRGLLSAFWACVAGFLGTSCATQILFLVGRRLGRTFLEKRPKVAAQTARVSAKIERYGALYVFFVRFLYGLRSVSVLLLGATGYPYLRFVVLDLLGAAFWTCAMVSMGVGLGATLKALLGRAGRIEELCALMAVIFVLGVWLRRRSRRGIGAQTRVNK